MENYRCPFCGYKTLESRGEFDICPVCFWEDDTYFNFDADPIVGLYYNQEPTAEELLDIPSGANHGLTLRDAQKNYRLFGACIKEMLPHVRKPKESEI